jgi:hypothetical protein
VVRRRARWIFPGVVVVVVRRDLMGSLSVGVRASAAEVSVGRR